MNWEALHLQLLTYAGAYAPRIVGVLLALLAARLLAGWAGRVAYTTLRKAKFDETLSKFGAKLAKWVVLLAAVMACLGVFGIQSTSFAALLGAAGLAIGLAFQGTLSNFAAGVMLLVFRPFKVGDVVTVAGQTGKVDEIELFTTTIDTADKRRFVIPNNAIFGSVIENTSHHPQRRVDVTVGVSYRADSDRVRAVLTAALGVEGTLSDPAPAVVLTGLGASSVDWAVRVWCRTPDYWAVRERVLLSVKTSLDAAGIAIPYPTMDINLSQPLATK